MEERKEGSGWMSVPAFGEWEHKDGVVPDYSVDFSKIRESRRQNKSRVSLGNEDELLSSRETDRGGDVPLRDNRPILQHRSRNQSPTRMKKIMSYFNCCGRLEA